MNTIQIPKSNGKVRVVVCPAPEEKRRLRALVGLLNLAAEQLDVHRVAHGFTEGRSPVTNAKVHIGWEFTVSFDLENCFDTISREMVETVLKPVDIALFRSTLADGCFVDGVARQGLPTSPALCNIALAPMDKEIWERFCVRRGRFEEPPCVYSRYADDLTFSCRTMATVQLLLAQIPEIVHKHGFKINAAKTKTQCARAGRRIITGISVGETDITISRELRRRLRAGAHQDKHGLRRRNIRRILFKSKTWRKNRPLRLRFYNQLKGLREWARLKPPHVPMREPTILNKTVAAVVRGVKAVTHQAAKSLGFGRKFG